MRTHIPKVSKSFRLILSGYRILASELLLLSLLLLHLLLKKAYLRFLSPKRILLLLLSN